MSAHTPRSWAVGKNKRFDGRIEVRKEPLGVLVALVEDPPDARLIAAAPDLLEALCWLNGWLESDRMDAKEAKDGMARVRAAITKATGDES